MTEKIVGRKVVALKVRPEKKDNITRIMSIDPGDVHNGIAIGNLDPDEEEGRQLKIRWQADWDRFKLIAEMEEYLNSQVVRVDAILIEKFVLYPWMARQQGFSEFPTVKIIGIIEYFAGRLDVPLIKMDTSNKNPAVAVARANQPRLLKTYGNRAKGKVYFTGSNEHERDALAHLAWFAWRDKRSPLYQALPGRKAMSQ
jgi:hypothetical protein